MTRTGIGMLNMEQENGTRGTDTESPRRHVGQKCSNEFTYFGTRAYRATFRAPRVSTEFSKQLAEACKNICRI